MMDSQKNYHIFIVTSTYFVSGFHSFGFQTAKAGMLYCIEKTQNLLYFYHTCIIFVIFSTLSFENTTLFG